MRMCRRMGAAFHGEREVPITTLEYWTYNATTYAQERFQNKADTGRYYYYTHTYYNTRIEFEIRRSAKKIHLESRWRNGSNKLPGIWVNLYDATVLPPGATMYSQGTGRKAHTSPTYEDYWHTDDGEYFVARADLVGSNGASFPPGKYAICICASEWQGSAYHMSNNSPRENDFVVTVTY